MVLKSLQYSEYENEPREWVLKKFNLNKVNLVVGKNSGGKTRTLNILGGLAKIMLEPKINYNSGHYFAEFETSKKHKITYEIKIKNKSITKESLKFNGETYVDRKMHGIGKIKNKALDISLDFKIPPDEVAITRRDSIQYPYLDELYNWGNELIHFRFNTQLGKNTLTIVDSALKPIDLNLKETDKAIALFRKGEKEFESEFKNNVIKDFNEIGYDITDIVTDSLISIEIQTNLTDKVIGLMVKERDREGMTDQNAMSMGMYRALVILIYFNYYNMKNLKSTVLIDDIGEGLDYERSTSLIKLLTRKALNNNIQLIMSTNDRFVMNNTPLEYWQIISRIGSTVNIINKENSKKIFDDFEFTGLSNFDFFSTNFFREGFKNSN